MNKEFLSFGTFAVLSAAILLMIYSVFVQDSKNSSEFTIEVAYDIASIKNLNGLPFPILDKEIIWSKQVSNNLNIEKQKGSLWIRFPAEFLKDKQNIIEVESAFNKPITLFVVDRSNQKLIKRLNNTGSSLAAIHSSLNKKAIFLVEKPEVNAEIIITSQSDNFANGNLIDLYSLDNYFQSSEKVNTVLMVYFGFSIFGLCLYCVYFWIYKDTAYLFAMGLTVCLSAALALHYEVFHHLFPSLAQQLPSKTMLVLVAGAYACAAKYIQLTFRQWEWKHVEKTFDIIFYLSLTTLLICAVLDYELAKEVSLLTHGILSPILLCIQVYFLAKDKGNKYFISGLLLYITWFSFNFMVTINIVNGIETFVEDIFLNHGLFIGAMIITFGSGFILSNNFRLVSEKKIRIEKELSKASQLLYQIDRMSLISGIASGIVHEIKQPLNWANMAICVAKSKASTEEASNALDDCSLAIKKIENIISELNWFSKGGELKTFTPLNLYDLVSKTIKMASLGGKNAITISNDVQKDLFIYGSETHLLQVFINLYTNSVKAIEEMSVSREGKIRIHASRVIFMGSKKIEIIWEDNGIGMEDEVLNSLFDPFKTHFKDGSGLGMSITKQILEHHGGKISAESKEGSWSRFKLELDENINPVKAKDAETQLLESSAPAIR